MYLSIDGKERDWRGFTFILPCVSVGNVGQLAADLIISTTQMAPVGCVYHEALLPVVGSDPFADSKSSSNRLTTSCEVYEDRTNKTVILQQRTPFAKGKRGSYVQWLSEWVKQQDFHQVLILTSSFAEERLDAQILSGSLFRYVASEAVTNQREVFHALLGWTQLENRPVPPGLEMENDRQGELYMPGSGIARPLYNNLGAALPTVVLMMFCSEGDNAQDAVAMAAQLNTWLQLKPHEINSTGQGESSKSLTKWKIPSSWRLVFGTGADPTLFH